jgi:hypothetical protein
MPVPSKFAFPSFTDEDVTGYLSESPAHWSSPTSLKNLSVLAGRIPEGDPFSDSAAVNNSRRPGHPLLFHRSGSGTNHLGLRASQTLASDDRHSRSRSHISISSDHDVPEPRNELDELRQKNMTLEAECGRLEGQIAGLR